MKTGDQAPDFSVKDISGKTISLSDYREGYVLIAFLRYAGCPLCNLAIHRLALEYELLTKENCRVIAFLQSEKQNIQKNIIDRHKVVPKFPLIADHPRKIFNKYAVDDSLRATAKSLLDIPHWIKSISKYGFKQKKIDGSLLLAPAIFLIDAQSKKIKLVEYEANFYDHASFTKIYEQIVFSSPD